MAESSPRGTAGYLTPYPYLDRLQERMEERLARKVPVKGRFCGFCYARLRETDAVCPFCARDIADSGTVDEIPQPVLKAYRARQRTEATWVYLSAFVGREQFRMEYRLRRADGQFRWILDHGVPRYGPGGVFEGFIGSCID